MFFNYTKQITDLLSCPNTCNINSNIAPHKLKLYQCLKLKFSYCLEENFHYYEWITKPLENLQTVYFCLFNSNLQSFYVQKNIVIYLNNSKNSFIAVIFIICNLFSQSGTFKMNILYRTDFSVLVKTQRIFLLQSLC